MPQGSNVLNCQVNGRKDAGVAQRRQEDAETPSRTQRLQRDAETPRGTIER